MLTHENLINHYTDQISQHWTLSWENLPAPQIVPRRLPVLLVNMIAHDFHHVAMVEGKGFKDFVEPGYKVPSVTHIAQEIKKQGQVHDARFHSSVMK